MVNNEKYVDKAEIIREKGTDRSKYLRAEIDKYTWQSLGSSFLPSELNASFLYAQLNSINEILEMRSSAWQNYYKHFQSIKDSKRAGKDYAFELPVDGGNAHMFSLVFERPEASLEFRKFMSEKGVKIATHYVPLHSSPAGKLYGRTSGKLSNTNFVAEGLIRMPLYPDVREHIGLITKMSNEFFLGNSSNR